MTRFMHIVLDDVFMQEQYTDEIIVFYMKMRLKTRAITHLGG